MELLDALPWARQSWTGRVRAIGSLISPVLAARRILRRERTEIVIGTGGYASVAPCLAAWTLGLTVVIHEANAGPGLANEILAWIADLICVDSPETGQAFGSGDVVVTGTPCLPVPPSQGIPQPPYRFIVLGGSEGSPWLNEQAPPLFAELRRRSVDFTVHHLTGMESPDATRKAYEVLGVPARVEGWINDMTPVYTGATFAIACPGARTLAELESAGIPTLLTPLPGVAHGHHEANARALSAHANGRSGARFVSQDEWNTVELAAWLGSLLASPDTLREMGEKMKSFARAGGAEAIVRAGEDLVKNR